jgi:hypothetical protein
MSLCQLCEGLTLEKLYPPNVYIHAASVEALEESAEDCRICALLAHSISCGFGSASDMFSDQLQGYTDEALLAQSSSIKLQILIESVAKSRHLPDGADGISSIGIWVEPMTILSEVRMFVEEGIDEISKHA